MSTILSSGFDGVSIQTSFVAGVSDDESAPRSREIDGREREPPVAQHLRQQSVRPPVDIVGEHHVVAGAKGQQQRGLGPEPAREREASRPILERGERLLESLPRGVPPARVVPDLRGTDLGLCVRRGLVDRARSPRRTGRLDPDPHGSPSSRIDVDRRRLRHASAPSSSHLRRRLPSAGRELLERLGALTGALPQHGLALRIVTGGELPRGRAGRTPGHRMRSR